MIIPPLGELEIMHNTVCKAVNDPKRIQILYALYDNPSSVNTLVEMLDMPQPTISRHLAILRQASLVNTEREGTSVIYSLSEVRVITVLDMMRSILRERLEQQATILE